MNRLRKQLAKYVAVFLILLEVWNMCFMYAVNAQDIPSQDVSKEASSSALPPIEPSPASPIPRLPESSSSQTSALASPVDQQIVTVAGQSAVVKNRSNVRKLAKKMYQANESVSITISDAKPAETSVSVVDPQGNSIAAEVIESSSGTDELVEIVPPQQFKPGTYTIQVVDWAGRKTEQNFTWGVLAINTNKSVYKPGEDVQLAIAVLDDKGGMVCDAKVNLQVVNPQGAVDTLTTENGKIVVNDSCTKKEITQKPDYEGSFNVSFIGEYQLQLTAETQKGTHTITDMFEVRESVPLDVERNAPTRIYPSSSYPVSMKITATEDFEGTVTETVPASFKILPYEDSRIQTYSKVDTHSPPDVVSQVLGASTKLLPMPFSGDYVITQGFGEASTEADLKEDYKKMGLTGHDGIDFAVPENTPILAVDDGLVIPVEGNGYGKTVVIQHSWGKTFYGHLNEASISAGLKVKAGDAIGISGSTGFSTAPHLHFGVQPQGVDHNNGFFGKIDPMPLLDINARRDILGESTDVYAVTQIQWNVVLKKGETVTLGYRFDAPDISPQFYLLGPAEFTNMSGDKVFEELRQWQIASDAYTGKQLKTVEYTLGGSSDNNTRTTATTTYAGSAWGTSQGTDRTVVLQGTGIRVRHAYLDVYTIISNNADINNIALVMDVTNGPAPGTLINVAEELSVITLDSSGLSQAMRFTSDVTALFDRQTDAQFAAGVGAEMGVTITGPSRRLTTAKLVITYESDYLTAAHTETKTVRFPLDSTGTNDTGTRQTQCAASATCSFTYTADIPDAAADADIMDVYFELHAEVDSATASTITPKINGGSAGTAFNWTEVLLNDTVVDLVFRPAIGSPDFQRNTAQTVDVTIGTIPVNALGGELVVTYNYSTGASSQTDTVRYYMDQRATDPSTTKNTFSKSITVSNTGLSVKNLWYKVHTAPVAAQTFTVFGTVGAAGETSNAYAITAVNPRNANGHTIIYDMSANIASFSSATTTVAGATQFSATGGSAPGVELYVTFTWTGSSGGVQTKTVQYSGAYQGTAGGASEWRNKPVFLALPETVTKTYRDAYIEAYVSRSDATNIQVGTIQVGVNGTTTSVVEADDGGAGGTDDENYSTILYHDIGSTMFSGGVTIGWKEKTIEINETINMDDETAFYNVVVITYDANFSETGSSLTGKSTRTVEYVLGGGSDNSTRTTTTTTFAGSAWGTSKGTDKTVTIKGSGIRVKHAFVDGYAVLTNSANITDLSVTADVTGGPAPGTDLRIGEETSVSPLNTSGLSNYVRFTADATALFDRQTDSDFSTGVGVEVGVTMTGPSRRLTTLKLVVTYEQDYSMSSHTETKTVRFPVDSTGTNDTGTRQTVCAASSTCAFTYTADIPDAAADADIMDVFFELQGEVDSTTASTMTPSISGGAAGTAFNWTEATLNDTTVNVTYRPSIGSPNFQRNTAQTLNIATGTVPMYALGGEVVVTYNYSTGAASQTETVKYYMDQRTTAPSTTKNTFSKSVTVSNSGFSVKDLWYKVHAAPISAQTFTVFGTVGAAGETSNAYAINAVNPRSSDTPTIIYELSANAASFSSSTITMAGATQYSGAGGAPAAVELYVTFTWTGTNQGTQTKSVQYSAAQSGINTVASQHNNRAVYTWLPETVTKTYRDAYVEAIVNHSQATSLTVGTFTLGVDGTDTTYAETADTTSEAYSFNMFHEISNTIFSGGATIGWYERVFELKNTFNQADERYFSNIITLTYDAAFPPAVETGGAAGTPTHVQSIDDANTVSGTTNAATFGSDVTTGNLVVVAIVFWNNLNNLSISSVVDNKGNSYQLAACDPTTTNGAVEPMCVYYAENVTGGSSFTVTATTDNSALITIAIHEYSGMATSSVLDKTAHTNAGGSANTSGNSGNTATTTQANELIFGAFTHLSGNTTATAGTNFTIRQNTDDNTSTEAMYTEDRTVNATAAYNATITFAGSVDWRAIVATFKGSASAAETPTNAQLMRHGRWYSSIGVKKPFTF
jgi:murein DD-endopeptidase MepM/ murein hydrolase activator NlpD/methionine-rich copper-binding protein CopC